MAHKQSGQRARKAAASSRSRFSSERRTSSRASAASNKAKRRAAQNSQNAAAQEAPRRYVSLDVAQVALVTFNEEVATERVVEQVDLLLTPLPDGEKRPLIPLAVPIAAHAGCYRQEA